MDLMKTTLTICYIRVDAHTTIPVCGVHL